jgi:PAS domain S-box-containing protein
LAPTPPRSTEFDHDFTVDTDFRSGDALVAFDADLRIVSWNEAAEELTGTTAEEAIGRPCWEVLCGVDTSGGLVCHKGCSGARLMREGWPVSAQELLIRSAGGRRQVMVSTVSVRVNGEDPVHVHVLRDGHLLHDPQPAPPATDPSLTPRQLEILEAFAAGEPAKRIAGRLGIAETTVRHHIRKILAALDCHSQLEAVAAARRRGLIN